MSMNLGRVCPNGHPVAAGDNFCLQCGAAVDVVAPLGSVVHSNAPISSAVHDFRSLPPSGAGRRFVAWLIDYGAGLMFSLLTVGIGLFFFVVFFFVNAWYEGETGQTLGKRTMKIYVIEQATGRFLGGPSGIGRHLLHILDGLPLGLGYIVGLITGRTFADRIVHSIVVELPHGA